MNAPVLSTQFPYVEPLAGRRVGGRHEGVIAGVSAVVRGRCAWRPLRRDLYSKRVAVAVAQPVLIK